MDYVTEVARREAKAVERVLRIEIGKKHDAFLRDFRRKDRRTSPVGSVTEDQHVTNGVSARALAEHGTNNLLRSVFTDHLGNGILIDRHHSNASVANRALQTDAVNNRVLLSHSTDDNLRAVENFHMRSGSVNNRVLLGHSTDNNLRAVGNIHIRDEVVTFHKLAKPCVGSIEIFDGNVINAKLAADSVTRSKVAPDTIGGVECGDSIKNAATNVFSLRTINNVVNAAAPFHVHSDLYKTWPKQDRRRFLDVRRALEGYRQSPRLSHLQGTARLEELDRRIDALAEALLGFYRIETDDPGMNAYEVEALLDDPNRADEAKRYKDAHRMDDWEYEKGRDPIPEVAGRLEMHSPGADGKDREAFRREAIKNFTETLRGHR